MTQIYATMYGELVIECRCGEQLLQTHMSISSEQLADLTKGHTCET